jgi:hypothetical protein
MLEYRVLIESLAYSVVGRLHYASVGQVLPEGTWDAFTTQKHIDYGNIELAAKLETAAPAIEVVEAEKALEDMTVAELKALCKEQGLAASGKKADLIARLHGGEEE